MLSFVMMIACAFTFTTYKASASTNADVPARAFTQENIAEYAIDTANRIAQNYTSPSCLIVDCQMFDVNDISCHEIHTLDDVVNSTFITNFAFAFGSALGIIDEVDTST